MPSSLTVSLSSALVLLYPTTCVGLRYGPCMDMHSGFSREHGYHRSHLAPGGRGVLSRLGTRADLPLPRIPTPLQRTIPSVRGCVTSPSPHRSKQGSRNLDRVSIGSALRLRLRPRLTLIRLALIRNPWSCGGRVSRPPCRYLYLHLLFRSLQPRSRTAFCGCRNAPLPPVHYGRIHGFGNGLMPDYYPRGISRPVSCYALFE